MLLTRAPLDALQVTPQSTALDLHVSCTPPALILSQDQTLHEYVSFRLSRNEDILDEAHAGPCSSHRPWAIVGKSSPLFNCQGARHAESVERPRRVTAHTKVAAASREVYRKDRPGSNSPNGAGSVRPGWPTGLSCQPARQQKQEHHEAVEEEANRAKTDSQPGRESSHRPAETSTAYPANTT